MNMLFPILILIRALWFGTGVNHRPDNQWRYNSPASNLAHPVNVRPIR